MAAAVAEELRVTPQANPEGWTRLDLLAGDRSVSHLYIAPYTLRVGAATVRMDGIADVWTDEKCRGRGYARRLLEEALRRMEEGDAALSMLYGVPRLYEKFGYITAGADRLVALSGPWSDAPLRDGWRARSFALDDLDAVKEIYAANTARSVGAAVRGPDAAVWAKLARTAGGAGPDACRVVESPAGRVSGYLWRGKGLPYVKEIEKRAPFIFVVGEAMAGSLDAGKAVLAACRDWARAEPAQSAVVRGLISLGSRIFLRANDEEGVLPEVLLPLPPEGPVVAAARCHTADVVGHYMRSGGSMARVLNPERLLGALRPELELRLRDAGCPWAGILRLRTDVGDATLSIAREGSVTAPTAGAAGEGAETVVELPQTALGRLALGAYPPEEILGCLSPPVAAETSRLLAALFPARHPHLYVPDRF